MRLLIVLTAFYLLALSAATLVADERLNDLLQSAESPIAARQIALAPSTCDLLL